MAQEYLFGVVASSRIVKINYKK